MTAAAAAATRVRRISEAGCFALHDTPAHAAATALIIAASVADPVRAQTARSLYPLIAVAAGGDGSRTRKRSPALAALVADTLSALVLPNDPRPQLVLSAERWLLHPQPHTAGELTAAATALVAAPWPADLATLEHAWLAGAGIESAVAAVRCDGSGTDERQLSAIAAATSTVVPLVWVAHELDISRGVLYRQLYGVDRCAWRDLLP